jgi:hypothetical protein
MIFLNSATSIQALLPTGGGRFYSNLAGGRLFDAYPIGTVAIEGEITITENDHFEVDHDAFKRDYHILIDFGAP